MARPKKETFPTTEEALTGVFKDGDAVDKISHALLQIAAALYSISDKMGGDAATPRLAPTGEVVEVSEEADEPEEELLAATEPPQAPPTPQTAPVFAPTPAAPTPAEQVFLQQNPVPPQYQTPAPSAAPPPPPTLPLPAIKAPAPPAPATPPPAWTEAEAVQVRDFVKQIISQQPVFTSQPYPVQQTLEVFIPAVMQVVPSLARDTTGELATRLFLTAIPDVVHVNATDNMIQLKG